MPRQDSRLLYLGLDLGTSGCRACAVDVAGAIAAEARTELPAPVRDGAAVAQDPALWWAAVERVMADITRQLPPGAVRAVAVDGTSGTVLVTDADGTPLAPALMYDDRRAVAEAERVGSVAPPGSAAHGTGSGLAKLLWLLERHPGTARVHTQADWVAWRLGAHGVSDGNNCLKLGWDAVAGGWPDWIEGLGVDPALLPRVVEPGTTIGRLRAELAARWGLGPETVIAAGTTDSTAAILATGASEPGDAVTSLGSTLVTKVVSETPVSDPASGVYSQPFRGRWLAGGGSNSGGAVLRRFFTPEEMRALTGRLDPEHPTGLDYYPLDGPGERFPVNDPDLVPRLEPRPEDDAVFFQGLLEGIAAIEARAYRRLAELGAPAPRRVFTVGGGAANPAWTAIRARTLGVPFAEPVQTEAAYGTALLARTAGA